MDLIIDNINQAIVDTKKQLKKNLPELKGIFKDLESDIKAEVSLIENLNRDGKAVIPEVNYEAINNEKVDKTIIAAIKHRGCAVIRNVFPKSQVEDWNDELIEYITENGYYEQCQEKAHLDQYFSTLQSGKPQVFGIYWSRPQVLARQDKRMAKTKAWLNNLWWCEQNAELRIDPNKECTYADRIRRREPGDNTFGLSPHTDAGSIERWIDKGYQKVYRHVFSGTWQDYDPFDATYRTEISEIPSPAVSHVFRTFQGWTALT
ncbi:MAG: YbiU family protein, partial [Candidatus Neomarinimicrobiota bacterium]|nr:YbiU family protein [Candidatus Neomarinimicrobiota bacterium]